MLRSGKFTLAPALITFAAVGAFVLVLNFAIPPAEKKASNTSNRAGTSLANSPEANVNDTPAANVNSTVNTNTSDEATKGWKTYTNVTYGYSIQYPNDYRVTPTPNGDVSILIEKGQSGAAGYHFLSMAVITEKTTGVSDETDLYTWAKQGFPDNPTIAQTHQNPRQETLGENTFMVTDGDLASSAIPEYMIFENNILYWIGSYPRGDGQISNRRVIGTLNLPDPTVGWKTYENATLGYAIKYPSDWTMSNDENKVTFTGKNGGGPFTTPYVTITTATELYEQGSCLISESVVEVDGKQATRQVEGCSYAGGEVGTFVQNNSGYIHIYWTEDVSSEYPTYENMLSTFTFTN